MFPDIIHEVRNKRGGKKGMKLGSFCLWNLSEIRFQSEIVLKRQKLWVVFYGFIWATIKGNRTFRIKTRSLDQLRWSLRHHTKMSYSHHIHTSFAPCPLPSVGTLRITLEDSVEGPWSECVYLASFPVFVSSNHELHFNKHLLMTYFVPGSLLRGRFSELLSLLSKRSQFKKDMQKLNVHKV